MYLAVRRTKVGGSFRLENRNSSITPHFSASASASFLETSFGRKAHTPENFIQRTLDVEEAETKGHAHRSGRRAGRHLTDGHEVERPLFDVADRARSSGLVDDGL